MFEPRLTFSQADCNSPLWINRGYGGFNKCVVMNRTTIAGYSLPPGSVLPDCTGYAWGRFMEILGEPTCTLSARNAGLWFGDAQGGDYETGFVPQVGAVLCLGQPGKPGHVCIVEEVHEDGSIKTSESGENGRTVFWTADRYPPSYCTGTYEFQGFIYNPAAGQTRLQAFLSSAKSHENDNNEWVCQQAGITRNQAWSAAFIVACAKSVNGLINVVIPNTYSCGAIGRIGVLRDFGTWHLGPGQGYYLDYEVGDLVLFRKSHYSHVNTYFADHCGICVEVNDTYITVMEGDCSGYVRRNNYGVNSSVISGVFRPRWEEVNSGTMSANYNTIQGLYTSAVTKKDACAREVGYLNDLMKPSIISSDLKLSVLNYTGLLGKLYGSFGAALSTSTASNTADQSSFIPLGTSAEYGDVNIDGLTSAEATTFSYLTSKGLNAAAACGVMGNIQAESRFRTEAVGDNATSFGICQWHNDRGLAMKRIAGANWASNLTGQLNYLWDELNGSYKSSVLFPLLACSNNSEGVKQASDIFVSKFEVPSAYIHRDTNPSSWEISRDSRRNKGLAYWDKIVTQL